MYAKAELQADCSVVMEAVKHGRGNGLTWADESLLSNRSLILAAARGGQGHAYALTFASPELRVDHELVHAAMDVDCMVYLNLTWDQQRALGPETTRRYARQLIKDGAWDFLRMAVEERRPGEAWRDQCNKVAYQEVVFQELAARGWNIHRLPSPYCHCQACKRRTPPCQRYIPRPLFGCRCCSEWGDAAPWWRGSPPPN